MHQVLVGSGRGQGALAPGHQGQVVQHGQVGRPEQLVERGVGGGVEVGVVHRVAVDEGHPAAHGLVAPLFWRDRVQPQLPVEQALEERLVDERVGGEHPDAHAVEGLPQLKPTLSRVRVGATGCTPRAEHRSDSGSTVPASVAMSQVSDPTQWVIRCRSGRPLSAHTTWAAAGWSNRATWSPLNWVRRRQQCGGPPLLEPHVVAVGHQHLQERRLRGVQGPRSGDCPCRG